MFDFTASLPDRVGQITTALLIANPIKEYLLKIDHEVFASLTDYSARELAKGEDLDFVMKVWFLIGSRPVLDLKATEVLESDEGLLLHYPFFCIRNAFQFELVKQMISEAVLDCESAQTLEDKVLAKVDLASSFLTLLFLSRMYFISLAQ